MECGEGGDKSRRQELPHPRWVGILKLRRVLFGLQHALLRVNTGVRCWPQTNPREEIGQSFTLRFAWHLVFLSLLEAAPS